MKTVLLFIIRIYQKYMSTNNNCRFYPSCSKFTYEAILKYGTIKGLFLGARRILHCHPFSPGGLDPVK